MEQNASYNLWQGLKSNFYNHNEVVLRLYTMAKHILNVFKLPTMALQPPEVETNSTVLFVALKGIVKDALILKIVTIILFFEDVKSGIG
ncbi:CLUMA_CG012404, isoform A [Clunio marinus]|uniref:CLUMA_CG012404, isoform A n=1 Tax=Clunio marinus TaxID=568069 RepID=A0A1J1IEJ5_9DIPT|nr:CLUMA_CG012404, isoform A [Clunio marinus]